MGDTCSCCSSDAQRLHEQQLRNASRPTYRKHKPLDEDYHSTDKSCCGGESELQNMQMEYSYMEQIPQKRKDEDTKVSEEPIVIPMIPLEGSTGTLPHPPKSKKRKKQKGELNRFHKVTQQQCIQFLMEMKAIVPVYVHRNADDRWTLSHLTFKRVSVCSGLHIAYDDYKSDSNYKEMKCVLLKNFEKVFNIKKHEMKDFKKLILWSVEMCPDIYFLDLNSSSTDAVFLGQLLDVLIQRNRTMHETKRYGPEILDIENIPIGEKGIELICNYLEANIVHTKWLKIGHCFSYEIPSELSEKLCNAFEKNEHILKMNIALRWNQHLQQIDQRLKKNKNKNNRNKKRQLQKRKMTV